MISNERRRVSESRRSVFERRRSVIATLAAVTALGVAGPASADDLRSPDVIDSATRTQTPADVRSPDVVDAATREQSVSDARTPDTVDFAQGRTPASSPVVFAPVVEPADGFDWGDAAIGAGGLLGLLGIAGGTGMLVVLHRRRDVAPTH